MTLTRRQKAAIAMKRKGTYAYQMFPHVRIDPGGRTNIFLMKLSDEDAVKSKLFSNKAAILTNPDPRSPGSAQAFDFKKKYFPGMKAMMRSATLDEVRQLPQKTHTELRRIGFAKLPYSL
jgi:hypothetical protein